jgi:hypothetical protein
MEISINQTQFSDLYDYQVKNLAILFTLLKLFRLTVYGYNFQTQKEINSSAIIESHHNEYNFNYCNFRIIQEDDFLRSQKCISKYAYFPNSHLPQCVKIIEINIDRSIEYIFVDILEYDKVPDYYNISELQIKYIDTHPSKSSNIKYRIYMKILMSFKKYFTKKNNK